MVGSYSGQDFTAEPGLRLEAELAGHGIPRDVMVYDGTKHSCFNDRGGNHNPAAEDARRRTIAFFEEHVTRGRRHARSRHPTLSTRFRPNKQHPPGRLPICAGAASGGKSCRR
jgi:hypothetical protein